MSTRMWLTQLINSLISLSRHIRFLSPLLSETFYIFFVKVEVEEQGGAREFSFLEDRSNASPVQAQIKTSQADQRSARERFNLGLNGLSIEAIV